MKTLEFKMDVPEDLKLLVRLFRQHGKKLFVVGGAVRDSLQQKKPKDFDLATDAVPSEVENILSLAGVKCYPRGESFGVMVASMLDGEYEIATFRSDGDYADGRHPEFVVFSTPEEDAKRRDLTINALFYDVENELVLDYNGTGIDDVLKNVIRTVGPPSVRFAEDRLRALRFIRFYCMKQPTEHIDGETCDALVKFRDLEGVSNERIASEFQAGVQKSFDTKFYIDYLQIFGLHKRVFGGMTIGFGVGLANHKDIVLILVKLIVTGGGTRQAKDIKDRLLDLRYSGTIANQAQVLARMIDFAQNPQNPQLKIRPLIVARDNCPKSFLKTIENATEFFPFFRKHLMVLRGIVLEARSSDFPEFSGKALGKRIAEADLEQFYKELK